MATSTISNKIKDLEGNNLEGVEVICELQPGAGFRVDDVEVAPRVTTTTDANGDWSLTIQRNGDLTPSGSYYLITEKIPKASGGPATYAIEVGDSDQTLLASLISPTVEGIDPTQNYLTLAAGDARYQVLGGLGAGTPTAVDGTAAVAGTSSNASREDHQHDFTPTTDIDFNDKSAVNLQALKFGTTAHSIFDTAGGIGFEVDVTGTPAEVMRLRTGQVLDMLSHRITALGGGSASDPDLEFGSTGTGFLKLGTDRLAIYLGGTKAAEFDGDNSPNALEFEDGVKIKAESPSSPSASAPGFAFNGDEDTGIYRAGANVMRLTAGGNNMLEVDGGALEVDFYARRIVNTTGVWELIEEQTPAMAGDNFEFASIPTEYKSLMLVCSVRRNATGLSPLNMRFNNISTGNYARASTTMDQGGTQGADVNANGTAFILGQIGTGDFGSVIVHIPLSGNSQVSHPASWTSFGYEGSTAFEHYAGGGRLVQGAGFQVTEIDLTITNGFTTGSKVQLFGVRT